jgi:hypothetical protein
MWTCHKKEGLREIKNMIVIEEAIKNFVRLKKHYHLPLPLLPHLPRRKIRSKEQLDLIICL